MYLLLFFVVIFVVSAVSSIIGEKAVVKETLKMFITTSIGMGILAFFIFVMSR